jgi:dihydrofolate synthase/folylpolyglutamate synthase
LKPGPLAPDADPPVWIDAAHNPGGAEVLAEAIKTRTPEGGDKVALVVAMQAVKDAGGALGALVPAVSDVIAIPLPDSGGQEGGPGADPHHLATIAEMLGAKTKTAETLAEGVAFARRTGADRIYIAGSVYLCGAALAANRETVS